ncbi:hypothetical protein AJ79_08866 [Helicocarpus griseus UAMH5409]|uniref:Uncharacterized protein n=1 Tax=Helicocarpus griseus UAMH5409 TaxID=1447875 RepID=A0A2B7WPL1_9EURO|nr:hypothetical protein AJ79_08866 [Helicocarpus griseus UAMH5409]
MAIMKGKYPIDCGQDEGIASRRLWNDLVLDDAPQSNIFIPHIKKLRALSALLSGLPGQEDREGRATFKARHFWKMLALIGTYASEFDVRELDILDLWQRLKFINDRLYDAYEEIYNHPGKPRELFNIHSSSHQDVVDDMLIWRTILISVLYFTAFDNSTLLESRVREHVVPII